MATDADLQRRTERFVLGALEALGNPATPATLPDDGPALPTLSALWMVTLPADVDPLARYQEPRFVAFDRDLADTWGADYVTLGSYLVDNLMDVARKKGRTANLFLPWLWPTDKLPAGWREEVPGLKFANCRAAVTGLEVVFHRFILWDFRVTLAADERRDIAVSLLSDPLTEEVQVPGEPDDGPDVLGSAVGWTDLQDVRALEWGMRAASPPRPARVKTGAAPVVPRTLEGNYQLVRLYRRACELLSTVVKDEVEKFTSAAAERLALETERLRSYYAASEQETLEELKRAVHRVASLGVRLELSRQPALRDRLAAEVQAARREMDKAERVYRHEVEALSKELKRRVAELEEKYRPLVTATLVGAAYLFRPRLEYQLELERTGPRRRGAGGAPEGGPPGGGAPNVVPRTSVVYFDLLAGTVAGLSCPSCGAPLVEAYLDDAGELVCSGCVFACAGCGRASTMPAESRRCHLCGEEFCRDCLGECSAGEPSARASQSVCRWCRELWCESCRNLLGGAGSIPTTRKAGLG